MEKLLREHRARAIAQSALAEPNRRRERTVAKLEFRLHAIPWDGPRPRGNA